MFLADISYFKTKIVIFISILLNFNVIYKILLKKYLTFVKK